MTALTLVVAGLVLLAAAWLRAAGTAITRVPRADALRDASDQVDGAEAVAGMLDDREVIGPAVGVVGSALLVVSATLGVAAVAAGDDAVRAVWLGLVVGLIVFVIGDLLPRGLGRVASHQIAYRSAEVLRVAIRLGGWANDLIFESEESTDLEVDHDEEENSVEQERELIVSVLQFSETLVREVMTPRPDMVTVPVTASIEELVALATEEGFSRIPVTADSDIVGLVIVKDLLPMFVDNKRPNSVAEVMRPVDFVPETKLAATLLAEMQVGKVHQMIVVDEYGDITGLITIEDLLEELVGEIIDETDEDELLLVPSGNGRWTVDARLPVEDLAAELGVELPEEESDTVGGLVLAVAERVPEEGESFRVGDCVFTVARMQGRRIAELTVVKDPQLDPA
ncbi:MAG: transporter associated domain-containing protein [Acidimicrobiia bacterium]|nr:transporter associated domain-containing protein [Acidimicrobiia bacterium]